jgi:hypothetical protein
MAYLAPGDSPKWFSLLFEDEDASERGAKLTRFSSELICIKALRRLLMKSDFNGMTTLANMGIGGTP